MIRFPAPLVPATLLRRYKRFLADVQLADGTELTAHIANPGSMMGLATPGTRVLLSRSADPKRKLGHSWELAEVDFGAGPELVGVSTALPNRLVGQALAAGLIAPCAGYPAIRREVDYGERSRVDFHLDCPARGPCYLEVKNVHLMRETGLAEFPDCVTARGARHMRELAAMVAAGNRAVVVFVIQIGSARAFRIAADIDPAYAAAFAAARDGGVEALAYGCRIGLDGIALGQPVPVT